MVLGGVRGGIMRGGETMTRTEEEMMTGTEGGIMTEEEMVIKTEGEVAEMMTGEEKLKEEEGEEMMKEESAGEMMTETEGIMVMEGVSMKARPDMKSVEGGIVIVMKRGEDGQTEMEITEERGTGKAGAPKKEIAGVQVKDTIGEIETTGMTEAGREIMIERGMKKALARGTKDERGRPREAWIG